MTRKTKPSTALATQQAAAPIAKTITRAAANELLKARAIERMHEDRAKREREIADFEHVHGRTDRIDQALLADLQRLQFRFAAIAARQRSNTHNEPKVNRFVEQLGTVLGAVSAWLATERTLELFAPVNERDYVGFNGGVAAKGYDASVLDGLVIVDDPRGPRNVTPTVVDDESGEVCLHEQIEPDEDEPTRGSCTECGREFELPATADDSQAA